MVGVGRKACKASGRCGATEYDGSFWISVAGENQTVKTKLPVSVFGGAHLRPNSRRRNLLAVSSREIKRIGIWSVLKLHQQNNQTEVEARVPTCNRRRGDIGAILVRTELCVLRNLRFGCTFFRFLDGVCYTNIIALN